MGRSTADIERQIREALSGCELIVRGMFGEVRNLIETQSDRPGHLQRNGRPLSDAQIAIAAGCASDVASRLLQELVDVGLLAKIGSCWFSKHLAAIAKARAAGARRVRFARERKRPALRNAQGNAPSNTGCNGHVTPDVTKPSPSLSLSPITPLSYPTHSHPPPPPSGGVCSEAAPDVPGKLFIADVPPTASDGKPDIPGQAFITDLIPEFADLIPPELHTPEFLKGWCDWEKHRRERRPKITPTSARHQLAKLKSWGLARALVALAHSTGSGYQGVFEPSGNGKTAKLPPRARPIEQIRAAEAAAAIARDKQRYSEAQKLKADEDSLRRRLKSLSPAEIERRREIVIERHAEHPHFRRFATADPLKDLIFFGSLIDGIENATPAEATV